MRPIGQPGNPEIVLADHNGEITLYIDGNQAMQAWEHDLMVESADLLCQYGCEFLEVGLGLGISALRIASIQTRARTSCGRSTEQSSICSTQNPQLRFMI